MFDAGVWTKTLTGWSRGTDTFEKCGLQDLGSNPSLGEKNSQKQVSSPNCKVQKVGINNCSAAMKTKQCLVSTVGKLLKKSSSLQASVQCKENRT